MVSALLSHFLPYRTALAVALIGALVLVLGVQTLRLDHADLKNEALAAQVAAQNAGIEAVKVEAAKRQDAAARAAKGAARALAKAEAHAARLEAAPVPQTCTEAVEFLVRDAAEAQ